MDNFVGRFEKVNVYPSTIIEMDRVERVKVNPLTIIEMELFGLQTEYSTQPGLLTPSNDSGGGGFGAEKDFSFFSRSIDDFVDDGFNSMIFDNDSKVVVVNSLTKSSDESSELELDSDSEDWADLEAAREESWLNLALGGVSDPVVRRRKFRGGKGVFSQKHVRQMESKMMGNSSSRF